MEGQEQHLHHLKRATARVRGPPQHQIPSLEGTGEGGADPGLKGRQKGSPRDPAVPLAPCPGSGMCMPWLGHVHALARASGPILICSLVSLESTGGVSREVDKAPG